MGCTVFGTHSSLPSHYWTSLAIGKRVQDSWYGRKLLACNACCRSIYNCKLLITINWSSRFSSHFILQWDVNNRRLYYCSIETCRPFIWTQPISRFVFDTPLTHFFRNQPSKFRTEFKFLQMSTSEDSDNINNSSEGPPIFNLAAVVVLLAKYKATAANAAPVVNLDLPF